MWNNGMTGQTITVSPSVTTQYCVIVTETNGCTDTSCVTVFVGPIDCISTGPLYLPNAFSPNGDGENDFLQIYFGNFNCINTFKLVLFDRWGERIFETSDPAFKWDGTLKGESENSAVFSFYMEATYLSPSTFNKMPDVRKGNISLVR